MRKDSGRKTSYKRKELGASVAPTLVPGVDGFKTPNDVLEDAINEYNGLEVSNDLAHNPKLEAGIKLEPAILEWSMSKLKEKALEQKVRLTFSVPKNAALYRLQNGLLGCSVDSMIKITGGEFELTDSSNKTYKLKDTGPGQIKNTSLKAADKMPRLFYQYQVQQEMLCTGTDWAILIQLYMGWDLQFFVIKKNHKMQQELIEAGTDFWNRFDGVLQNKDYYYPPDTSREASKLYKGNGSEDIVNMDGNNELGELLERYTKQKQIQKDNKVALDVVEKQIKQIVKNNEKVSYRDFIISHSTIKKQKTKSVPIPEQYTEYRRFSIKGGDNA